MITIESAPRLTLKAIFAREEADWIWIKSLPVIKHLVGFTGSTAQLLASREGTLELLVDGRYLTQAGEECHDCTVRLVKRPLEDLAARLIEAGARRVGFEARVITYLEHMTLRDLTPSVEWRPLTDNLAFLRVVKTAAELDKLRAACRLADKAYQDLVAALRPGMTEREAGWFFDRRIRELGASGNSFDTIVVGGPRSALIHGKPADRRFAPGDFVLVDRGIVLDHYVSDETTTLVLGEATPRQREIYAIVKEAHDRCIEAVRPGITGADLDAVAREIIVKAGYGEYFGHGTGHGVGLEVHEMPAISALGATVLEPGMVFSVEPGIYIPDWGGVRIEDLVIVTKTGAEVITLADKKLIELPIA